MDHRKYRPEGMFLQGYVNLSISPMSFRSLEKILLKYQGQ